MSFHALCVTSALALTAFMVTDNDGLDDSSGETPFLNLGAIGPRNN